MAVGISASCMPALAKLARNGTAWHTLQSKIAQTFSSILSSKRTNQGSEDKATGLENGSGGPYTNIDETKSSVFEMDKLKSVRTSVKAGTVNSADQDDDGIQLKVSVHQDESFV